MYTKILIFTSFSSLAYCSLEDVHNTLDTLNDNLYKIRQSHELFLYDLMQAKTHNEFKEAIDEITAAINGPLASAPALATMKKLMKSIQTNFEALKIKTDALEELRKSYKKTSATHVLTEQITSPDEVREKRRSKGTLRTEEHHIINELENIIIVNRKLIQQINLLKNKSTIPFDMQIYGTCSLLVTVFNSYIETVIKKTKHDLKI